MKLNLRGISALFCLIFSFLALYFLIYFSFTLPSLSRSRPSYFFPLSPYALGDVSHTWSGLAGHPVDRSGGGTDTSCQQSWSECPWQWVLQPQSGLRMMAARLVPTASSWRPQARLSGRFAPNSWKPRKPCTSHPLISWYSSELRKSLRPPSCVCACVCTCACMCARVCKT